LAAQLYSGTGDPNGTVFGNPGDVYTDEAGGGYWYKLSGANTNTNWTVFVLPDVIDTPGVQVDINVPTSINPATAGRAFTANALNRSDVFFIQDGGPNNVRGFFNAYVIMGYGFAYFSVEAPVLVTGNNLIPAQNTCIAFNPPVGAVVTGFQLTASPTGYASQGLPLVRCINYGPNPITLSHDNPAAPAGSRMLLPGAANLPVPVNGFVELQQFQFPVTSPNRAWALTSKNF
jgi:hypothetical protein